MDIFETCVCVDHSIFIQASEVTMTYTNAKLAVDGINYLLPHSRLGWAMIAPHTAIVNAAVTALTHAT